MENKLKIKISSDAFKLLKDALDFDNEYNCIRLQSSEKKCCKSSKVQIIFDNKKSTDIEDKIEDLSICYDETLPYLYKEVIVVLSKGNLYVKAQETLEGLKESSSKCSSCSGCSGCSNKK